MDATLAVVGAGAAAAAATYAARTARPSLQIDVFEKSRGVCGRAAARRRNGIVYDYGANFLLDKGGRASAFATSTCSEGLVEIDGPVASVDAEGTVRASSLDGTRRWTYEDGITRLAKHLFAAAGVDVQRETRIVDIRRRDASSAQGGWRLADADGDEYGPFDVLLLNPPAPQTATLLRDTGVEAVDHLGAAARTVEYQAVWTAVLGYDFEIDVPYYGLRSEAPTPTVGWIGREECKPGHVPKGQSVLVVQAGPNWTSDHYDAPPEDNIDRLCRRTAEIIGDRRLTAPAWTDWQGWKYAFPQEAVEDRARLTAARNGVYVCGDWVAGTGRLDAAVENGLATGSALVDALP